MPKILVEFNNVLKYDIKNKYDFIIEEGDCIVVSGENGSGKTTLIELLLGFIYPDKGNIYKEKLKIGYLPAHTFLPPYIKVKKYLDILAKIKKTKLNDELLSIFDLPLSKNIFELSKGNQQKLSIISSLIGTPNLIIFDEPLTALDVNSQEQLLAWLKKYIKKQNSLLIITHHVELFSSLMTKQIKL